MLMDNIEYFDIEIDKLTNSIENRIDGNVYDTAVVQMFANFNGTKMFIETPAALRLIKQYFNDIK